MEDKKAKDLYFKKVSDYLQVVLNDFDRKRLLDYMQEYFDTLPREIKIVREIVNIKNKKNVLNFSDEFIDIEANKICKEFGISYHSFRYSNRSTAIILSVRKAFCQRMIESYNATRNQLIAFFNVDHSTLSYYLIGKKIRKQKIKNNN